MKRISGGFFHIPVPRKTRVQFNGRVTPHSEIFLMALGARLQLKQEYLWSTWKQQNVGSAKQMCGSLPVEGKITLRAQVRNVTCQELQ